MTKPEKNATIVEERIDLKDSDFLKVSKYYEDDYWCYCIISERGQGKTHSCVVEVDEDITNNGGKCVFTRLNMEPFKKFKDDVGQMAGWTASVAGQTIKKDGQTIGYLASLNTYANAKGGTYNDVKWMIFDEFNEDVYVENAYAKFVMLIDSFKRHRKDFKCILLGNMINKNNWFLNAMGIRADWKAKEDQIILLPDYGVKIVIVGSETHSRLKKARSDINKLAAADPSSHAFYNEREFLNDDTTMVTNYVKWVKPTFECLFFYTYKEYKYIFGKYKETDGKTYFFTDRDNAFFNDVNRNVPEFSFDGLGALISTSSRVVEEEDVEDFQQQFFVLAKQRKLVFGSFDCFEDLQVFISGGMLKL